MEASYWDILKGEIHEKCVFYDYIDPSDMSLAEFILNIIQMGKSAEEVNQELFSLIGDDYDQNMTQWMFLRLEELKNPQPTALENSNHSNNGHLRTVNDVENRTAKTASQAVPEKRNRLFAQAMSALREKKEPHPQYKMNGVRSPSPPSSSSSRYRITSHSRSRSRSPHRYDSHSRSPARSHHRYTSQTRSRSRSRSPEKNKERTSYRDRKENDIQSRLGKRVPSQSSVFDRLGIQKPESINEQLPKQRCKYWPECDKGDDCLYIHPDTLCPDFPNCPKPATECLFIHPETRPKKSAPTINPNLTQKAIPCRFFPYCTNEQCPYFHPPLPTHPPMMTAVPSIKRIPVPCKNGDQCERPDCHFLHPNDTNPSEIICKFDGACTRPGCFYKHTIQPTTYPMGSRVNKTLIIQPNSSEPKKHTNERLFAVTDDNQVEKMVLGESADIIKM